MRFAAVISLTLGLSATVALAATQGSAPTRVTAAVTPGAGSFEVQNGRGMVQISGKGVLVGRMDKGTLEILDLSPTDGWSPRVYGIPRGKTVTLRGKNVSFYIPAGRYRVIARGVGISISGRGSGVIVLDGDPDAVGDTGTYAIGDAAPAAVPAGLSKATFGPVDAAAPSS